MAEQEKQNEETKASNEKSLAEKPGFDFTQYLPHLLSALTGMGGSYFLFGKPTQDQIKEVASRIIDLEKKINTLWEERAQNKKLEKQSLNGQDEEEEDEDYLLSKQQNTYAKKQQRKQIKRLR